jgi:proteasome lid subunit RPN8/RPN11
VLRIFEDVYAEMVEHCLQVSPQEAVGLLAGHLGLAMRVQPLPNIAPPPDNLRAFLADPYEQFQAERRIARCGMELVAVYHSHPGGGAALSVNDIAVNWSRLCIQVVVAFPMVGSVEGTTRAFQIIHGEAVEVPIVIVSRVDNGERRSASKVSP